MKLPYGYVLVGEEIVIHKEKADVVRSILHFIDILKNTSKVSIRGDHIELNTEFTHSPENYFLQFCANKVPNPIRPAIFPAGL